MRRDVADEWCGLMATIFGECEESLVLAATAIPSLILTN
jgi:hypothetical protein